MSRGGRGGGSKFQGGRPRGPNVPFDIDPELLDAVDQAEEKDRSSDDDFSKELFPDLRLYITAAPVTDEERRGVQLERRLQAKRRAGPFWTGTNEQWAEIDSKTGRNIDSFESIATYGRKRTRKPFALANLKRVKVCYPQFLPKELHDVVTDPTDGTGDQPARKKVLGLAKKSAVDKLAKFDDDEARLDANDHPASEDEDERDKEDEEDFEREPEDDEFNDEDDDNDNDYNAEKYFDDGEDDVEDGDGDDHGDDGY